MMVESPFPSQCGIWSSEHVNREQSLANMLQIYKCFFKRDLFSCRASWRSSCTTRLSSHLVGRVVLRSWRRAVFSSSLLIYSYAHPSQEALLFFLQESLIERSTTTIRSPVGLFQFVEILVALLQQFHFRLTLRKVPRSPFEARLEGRVHGTTSLLVDELTELRRAVLELLGRRRRRRRMRRRSRLHRQRQQQQQK